MRPDPSLRTLFALAVACAVFAACRPAHAQAVVNAGTDPVAIAINTVTNKIYVANEFSDDVTVIDGATNTTRSVKVGKRPQHIAVNSKTNRIYVNTGTDSSVAVIDGNTLAVTTLPVGSNGRMVVNEATNKVYVMRTGPTDEVTIIDGATNNWYSVAIDSYWPIAQALHVPANRLYVATYATGDVRVVDLTSTSAYPPTQVIKTWNKPVAIALNPNTGRGYILTEQLEAPINIANLGDNSVSYLQPTGHGSGPRAIAVNAATDKIYGAFEGEIMILDGATHALTWVASSPGIDVVVNPNKNLVYIPAADGSMAVVNGATNAVTRVGIPVGAKAIAVNPNTGRVYIVGPAVTILEAGAAPPPPPPPPPPPATSVNVEGLWWGAPAGSESGWGLNLTHQGNVVFGTWFTYDADGSGMWLVMPNGRLSGANTFSGEIYRTTGPPYTSVPFDPALVQKVQVGSGTLTFTDANNGRFVATVNGVSLDKSITRQAFGAPMPVCAVGGPAGPMPSYQDLWWGSPAGSESGWGVNLAHQGNILFVTWFTYAADGRGMWLVGPDVRQTGNATFAGKLYRTTGPAFNAKPWSPALVGKTEVGSIQFTFSGDNAGMMTSTVGGVTLSKSITRQSFATPPTVCR
jgi:YVTN family beta-propeller protein